jgi:hypothetical protein
MHQRCAAPTELLICCKFIFFKRCSAAESASGGTAPIVTKSPASSGLVVKSGKFADEG